MHNGSSTTETLEGGVHVTSVAKVTQTSESIALREKRTALLSNNLKTPIKLASNSYDPRYHILMST